MTADVMPPTHCVYVRVCAASQRSVIRDSDKVLQERLDELRQEHQETLQSLTQKCLTMEKDLGKLGWVWVSWGGFGCSVRLWSLLIPCGTM